MKQIGGLLLCCLIFAASKAGAAADPFTEMGVVVPHTRVAAPEFVLPDLKGRQVALEEFRGKVILLNFWATWCPPCRKEMPSMEAAWRHFKDREFVILAVAADRGNQKGVGSMAEDMGLTYPILLDPDGEVRNAYEIFGLPMTYLIGRDGKISGRLISERDWAGDAAFRLIEQLLAK